VDKFYIILLMNSVLSTRSECAFSDYFSIIHLYIYLQNKRDETILKRRNVPHVESTDSEENEKPVTQSLESIVQNAASSQPAIQLNAVQAARYYLFNTHFVYVLPTDLNIMPY